MTVQCIGCGKTILDDTEHNMAHGVEPYPFDWDQGICKACDKASKKSDGITPEKRLELLRKAASGAWQWVDGVMVDATTAGWLTKLYDALSEQNRHTLISMDVTSAIALMYKLEKKGAISLGFK